MKCSGPLFSNQIIRRQMTDDRGLRWPCTMCDPC